MQKSYSLVIAGTSFASSFFLKNALNKLDASARILVLERGKRFPHKDRIASKIEDVPLGNPAAASTFISQSDKKWTFDPSFGGSSNCWTGCTPRFLPSDFQMKSKYGVAQDWPISYQDILPYYEEVESIMSIGGPKDTPWPMQNPYPLPPQVVSTVDKKLQDKYGHLYISQPTARATMPVGIRAQCCTSAVCNLCPVNSKFTIDNSLDHLYNDPRVTLSYDSQMISFSSTHGIAREVHYIMDGKDYTVNCETLVLGTNAIFNAHILLNSGDTNKLTGTGICEQAGKFVRVYYKDLSNVGGSSVITANGFMGYDGEFRRDSAGYIIESFNTPFIRNEKGKWRNMSIFKFIYEDLPQVENRVMLSDDIKKPKIEYNGISNYAKRGIGNLEAEFNKYFSFLPIEDYEIENEIEPTEFHICSTTRMGTSNTNSVINKNLIHHDFSNVLVLGSGAYPTITPSNPTLTLSALSLMAANEYFK